MIRKVLWRALAVLIVLSMAVPFVQAAPAPQEPPPNRPKPSADERLEAVQQVEEVSLELAMSKIDPMLKEAAEKGGRELVDLYVSVKAGTDLSQYMARMYVRPVVFGGTQNVYGQTAAGNLLKIAQDPNVLALVAVGGEMRDKPYDPETDNAPNAAANMARIEALRANELTYAEAQAQAGEVGAEAWFDVRDGHKSNMAWDKGFTGEGVVVGVLDDGIDFAHPDLMGTYATVTDPASPYYGWPMAFSQVSTLYFVQDIVFGVSGIADGWGGSRWTDAQYTVEAYGPFGGGTAKVWYQPLGSGVAHEYTIPTNSLSHSYKLGSHPERHLLNVYGERVAVLVVDEHVAGRYDTVYVDLDNDYDFTDEKPTTRSSPEIYRDMDGDGYADISGGLLVWISDGANVPPTADWLWGITCADSSPTMQGCPDSGDLILFAGPFDTGYSHGTACSSHINAQGVIAGGLSVPSFRVGGMSQGAAPDAGVMDFGNHYYTGTDEDEYLVAALGYDGVPNSGDEVQITTNSYGNFRQMWGAWGYFGRLITALNMTVAPSTVWIFSSGNEGPGYGPQEGDGGPTTIQVGSSTQFGSTSWDSILSADQIMYGDPSAYFSKGPNRDGSSGLDVLANGGRGAASAALNTNGLYGDVIPFNGWTAWETWGGTSRAGPVAGGNLALVYQAYKARYGMWPTWDVAKALLKSGATNSVSSPFYQGAGVVNADRTTDLAAGIYGVYATPTEWQVGDWQGTDYLNFANVASPGDTFTQTFSVNNPSGRDIRVNLSDGVMTLITKTMTSFTTVEDERDEGSGNFNVPDYLMKLDSSLIPADAELMVVRQVHPYDTYDSAHDFTPDPNSSWRFFVYNWTDQNGDGKLWEDKNGDGLVDFVNDVAAGTDNDGNYRVDFADPDTEIQEGEYIRLDYAYFDPAQMIIVHDPLERMANGYYFGWRHHNNDGTVPTTTFEIGLEFYKRADWDWLSLSDSSLVVPAEGSATFDAVAAIPANATPGAHEGVIFVNDQGDAYHDAHETALPVVVNVIADLPDGGSFTLGGGPMADTLYQNSWTYGYFNWYGGGWTGAGDWRHYFFDVDDNDLGSGPLLVHTSWDAAPTDLNTWLLGPTEDCASNGVGPCAWYQPGLGQPDPTVFGPYTLQPIAENEAFRAGAAYPFDTATGGPDDWLVTPLDRAGLHEIALHNVLYNGEQLAEQFQVDVGHLDIAATVTPSGIATLGSVDADTYTTTGQVHVWFTPTIDLPGMNANLSGGLVTDFYGPFSSYIPDTGGCYSAWCPGNVYEPFMVTQPGAINLHLHLYMQPNQDADFFLVYDANDNGVAEQGIDPQIGSSGNSSGTDEDISVDNPDLGRYFAVIDGYDVDPDSGVWLDWDYDITAPGPLPANHGLGVFDGSVTGTADDPFDPFDAGYTYPITMDARTSALTVTLYQQTPDVDFDLYVIDENDQIVARSTNSGTSNESIVMTPEGHRFEPGSTYTVLVHGQDLQVGTVLLPSAQVWLSIVRDELKMWLEEEMVDSIDAGESSAVIVNFDDPTMVQDVSCLSARLTTDLGDLSLYSDLVNACYVSMPGPPGAPAPDATFSKSFVADRGPSDYSHNGYPTALVNIWDTVTFTLKIANSGTTTGTFYAEDWILPDWEVFESFVVTPTNYGWYDYGWSVLWFTETLGVGEEMEVVYRVKADNPYGDDLGWVVPNYLDVYDDDTFEYYGGDINYIYFRSFRMTGSYKMADVAMVYPGDTVNYTIALMNPSSEDRNVFVSDRLDPALEFVSATNGATYDAVEHRVTWGGMLAGSSITSQTIDVQVTVADTALVGDIDNCADVYMKLDAGYWDSYCDSIYVQPGADVNVTKEVDDIDALGGDTLAYSIVMQNAGPMAASGATLSDMIPMYLTVVTDSLWIDMGAGTTMLPADAYDEDYGLLSWAGDLAAGDTYTITFQATITDSAPEGWAIINLAELRAANAVTMRDGAVTEIVELLNIYLPIVMR